MGQTSLYRGEREAEIYWEVQSTSLRLPWLLLPELWGNCRTSCDLIGGA